MTDIIAFVNQKGGVGKTSGAYNCGFCLANKGKKTLLIDIDPSRNASKPYCSSYQYSIKDVLIDKDLDPNKAILNAQLNDVIIANLDIIPSHVSLATIQNEISTRAHNEKLLSRQISKIKRSYDYIILDCPPLLSAYSVVAVYASNFIVIPLRYEKDALEGVQDLFDFIAEIKENQEFDYKILRNGYDARKKTVNAYVDSELDSFIASGKVFKTVIRQDEEINKAKLMNEPVLHFAPKSYGAQDFLSFAHEIIEVLHD